MLRPSRTIALIALTLWVVVGPLAAVFGACAAMGAMCEGPCGVGPCAILFLAAATLVLLVFRVPAPPGHASSLVLLRLLDPPPRPLAPTI